MAWYFYSIVTMLVIAAMMLIIKKIRDMGFSSMQVNLFLFGFVFLGFLLANSGSLAEITNSSNFRPFVGLLIGGAVAAIFANLAHFKAVGIAPNPGYSQAIKGSDILLIIVLSIFIFGLRFDLMKFFWAILVVVGITLLIKKGASKPKQGFKGLPWYLYSLGAMVGFTAVVLTVKQATLFGFSSIQINLFLFGFSWLGFLILGHREWAEVRRSEQFLSFLGLVFLASVCSFIGNLFDVKAIGLAPNPGYAQAIKNTNILVITLLSTRFFASDFTPGRVIGAVAILVGITLLVL